MTAYWAPRERSWNGSDLYTFKKSGKQEPQSVVNHAAFFCVLFRGRSEEVLGLSQLPFKPEALYNLDK